MIWIEACELREGDVLVGELFHYDGALREPGEPLQYFIEYRWEGELVTKVYPRINITHGTMSFKTDALDEQEGARGNRRHHTTPNSWLLVEV